MERQVKVTKGLMVSLLLVLSVGAQAATEVGEVTFSRGVLTGQIEGATPRILGKGNPLHNGQTLNTGSSGFAVIKLDDGSRMTLRPNTTFKIENVNTEQGSEGALMRLFRGGFRAITGFISKRRPGSFKVNTTVATIGIRGTEFDARLCEADECDKDNQATGKAPTRKDTVIGRIAVMNGRASAVGTDNQARVLKTGAPIYEQDKVETGIKSFAVVAFNDESRVTMSPESVFQVEEHKFKPESAPENNAFLRFVRGGMRLVTGLIGKFNRSSYRVATPTATIGIRGTGFDLACDGECVENTASFDPLRDTILAKMMDYFVKPVYAQNGNGMYARVWSGAIEFQTVNGNFLAENGQVFFLRNAFSRPVAVAEMPVYLRTMGNAPRPDRITVPEDLFGANDDQEIKPGLWVTVRDGNVDLPGVTLGPGQAGKVDPTGRAVQLNFIPPFQQFDPTPNPATFDPTKALGNLFGGQSAEEGKELECSLQ
jgi:hypothetical protein